MWDRDLVSRLSSKAAQVLLSLLLTRQIETQQTAAEFAKTTGLGQRSIAPALLELRDAGLIDIVPQPGKPPLVRLIHPDDVQIYEGRHGYETTITEAGPEHLGAAETPTLASPATGVGVDGGETGAGGVQGVAPDRLIEQCRMADESKDKELRIAALQDVWDYAFPFDEYPDPTQRMSNGFAQRLLVNRSAEWVGGVIIDAVDHSTSRIQAPRAYIQKAVDTEEKRKGPGQESGQVISDDLRKLVQLGKEQFGAKDQDGPGDIE